MRLKKTSAYENPFVNTRRAAFEDPAQSYAVPRVAEVCVYPFGIPDDVLGVHCSNTCADGRNILFSILPFFSLCVCACMYVCVRV